MATADGSRPLIPLWARRGALSTRLSRTACQAVCSTRKLRAREATWAAPAFGPAAMAAAAADDPGSSTASSRRSPSHSGGTLPFSTPPSSRSSGLTDW